MLRGACAVVVIAVAAVACGGAEPAALDAASGDGSLPEPDASGIDAPPPEPAGCIDSVTAGDHVFTCAGLQVDARVPAQCLQPGCGLILELHGDTGTGLLMDGHTKLRELGAQYNYIVIAPSGPPFGNGYPGSTWRPSNDAALVAITEQFRDVFRVDPKRIHVTGFSRGGFVTWRMICDHAELFASAAPAGAGDGDNFGETTCFSGGHAPARQLPILFMLGRTDASVGYASMAAIRDHAIASYGVTGPVVVASDARYSHERWSNGTTVIETFDHAYETVPDGPWADAQGHCIAGSLTDPYAPQYAIPCKPPNAFTWGVEVMAFFRAHPMP